MLNFLHIPKCGGSTIRNYIRTRFTTEIKKNPDVYSIFIYGANGKMGKYNYSKLTKEVFDDEVSGLNIQKKNLLGIIGHYSFKDLSDFWGFTNFYGNTFTIVRNPIDRIVSNLNYLKVSPTHPGSKYAASITQEKLMEHLISQAKDSNGSNYQCNMLGANFKVGQIASREDMLNSILNNLNVYKLESSRLAIANHIVNLEAGFEIDKKNVTKEVAASNAVKSDINYLSVDFLGDSDINLLREIYHNDFLLYEMAK